MAARLWERPLAGLLVVLVAAALYAPTIALRRVDFDDYWLWSDVSPLRDLDGATVREVFLDLDGESRRPLGITVVGGLAFSQLITLYVTPVIYTYLDKLGARVGHFRWRNVFGGGQKTQPAE